MSGLKVWLLGAAAGVVVIGVTGGLLGVQPALSAAAADDEARAAAAAQADTLQVTLAGLAKAAARQPELEAEQERLLKSMPSTLKPNTFVRRVNELAALNGVEVAAVSPGSSQPYEPPAAAPQTAGSATEAPAADPAAPAATTEPLLAATDPLITSANLVAIPMDVTVRGSAHALLAFTHDLQNDERLYLVSGYTAAVDTEDGTKTSATLSGYVYALKR